MKVLIIPSWYTQENNPVSGIFFKEQAMALKEQGLAVTVMYPELKSIRSLIKTKKLEFENIFIDEGLPTYRKYSSLYVPKIISSYLYRYEQIANQLFDKIIKDHGKPDIIHAHAILYGGWIGARLAKKYNIPLVITEHSSAYSRGLILDKQKPYIQETLQQASEILAVGEGLINELSQYTDKAIKYMPNIVDVEFAKKYIQNSSANDEKFIFFTLSLLSANKKVDNIIKAFSKIVGENPQCELWIGGDGEERKSLEQLAKEYDLEDKITFFGMLDRATVFEKMNACHTFISASEVETFGVVLIEALSVGTPIIATKSGGPNLIVNEENGLLVEVNDINGLAQAMLRMKENYTKYDTQKIIEDCNNKYSKEIVCKSIISVYNGILKEN